jgi:hypothetical protein
VLATGEGAAPDAAFRWTCSSLCGEFLPARGLVKSGRSDMAVTPMEPGQIKRIERTHTIWSCVWFVLLILDTSLPWRLLKWLSHTDWQPPSNWAHFVRIPVLVLTVQLSKLLKLGWKKTVLFAVCAPLPLLGLIPLFGFDRAIKAAKKADAGGVEVSPS